MNNGQLAQTIEAVLEADAQARAYAQEAVLQKQKAA
jgi:1-deoxy-D-xylulose-5-phosphate reductoisomerase